MEECKTPRTQYDTPTKNRLVGAIEAGKSVREAGRMFGVKKSTADRIWKRYKSSGNTENLPRSGRPTEVSERTKRLVLRTAITHRRKAFREIANEMLPKISESTVRNILAAEGYHRRAARKVPYLTKRHKIDRMRWAQLYKAFTNVDWAKVIWSDECYVYIGDDRGRIYVTRRADEELNEDCLVPRFKQSSVRVMLWACIMKGRKGPLIVLEYPGGKGGGMNSTRYKEQVLEGVLASFHAEVTRERGKVHFQQDGAASHRSKSTQNWFSTADIPLLYHPASSPDLSPIEPVWHELKKILRALPHPPTSVDKLCDAVRGAWDSLPISDIDKHIDTMQERVQAILAAKGGHTRF